MSFLISPYRSSGGVAGPSSTRWRLNITAVTGSGASWVSTYRAGLAEVEMRATAGGADQCTGGSASAQGTQSGSSASNAFANDGATTVWIADPANTVPRWIEYTFASAVNVEEVALTCRNDRFTADGPCVVEVQYYDGSTWQTYWTITTGPFGSGETRVFNRLDAAEGKRVWACKITATQTTAVASCSALEFRTSSGGANVATGGYPTADGASASNPASNAFDGNNATFWIGQAIGALPDFIGYALPSDMEIVEVSFRNRPDAFGVNESPKDMEFGYFVGATFTSVWSVTGEPAWSAGETRVYTKP